MSLQSRRDILFLLLSGVFISNALIAEMIGGKLITLGPFAMSIGVIPWPVVFLTTDIINEYFGREGVKRLTLVTIGLIAYAFFVLFLAMRVPAASFSPVSQEAFTAVFGQSLWIIAGSIIAFAVSQLTDVSVFWFARRYTGGKKIWLRATGSTAVSQMVDSFVIIGIAFWLPGKVSTEDFLNVAFTNYSYKFLIALFLTPLIYLGHGLVKRFLGPEESLRLVQIAAQKEN